MAFFDYIFPFIANKKANNKIEKKIELLKEMDNIELTYMKNYNELKMKDVKSFYNNNQEVKKILEDKAKTNIIGLTISISLIMGFMNISELINNIENLYIKIIILILAIMSVGYMIGASLLSIALLVNKNGSLPKSVGRKNEI